MTLLTGHFYTSALDSGIQDRDTGTSVGTRSLDSSEES